MGGELTHQIRIRRTRFHRTHIHHGRFFALLIALASTFASGCAYWGEAPITHRVHGLSATETTCGNFFSFLWVPETESQNVLDCWEKDLLLGLNSVEGSTPGQLSRQEVAVLINHRLLNLTGNLKKDHQLANALFDLGGFDQSVRPEEVSLWISWLRARLTPLRTAWDFLQPRSSLAQERKPFSYEGFDTLLTMVSEFLRQSRWKLSIDQLAEHILVLSGRPTYLERSAASWIEFLSEITSTFCSADPKARLFETEAMETTENTSQPGTIAAAVLGSCIREIRDSLRPGSVWLEHWIDSRAKPDFDIATARDGIRETAMRLKNVIANKSSQIRLELFLRALRESEIILPDDAEEKLERIELMNVHAWGDILSPKFFLRLIELSEGQAERYLDAMADCELSPKPSPSRPRECTVDLVFGPREAAFTKKMRKLHPYQIGIKEHLINSSGVYDLALQDTLAALMVKSFDRDQDGLIVDSSESIENEIFLLTESTIWLQNLGASIVTQMRERVKGIPPQPIPPDHWSDSYNLAGLAQLVALSGSEILMDVPKSERAARKLLKKNVQDKFGPEAGFLDQASLAAVVHAVFRLPKLRDAIRADLLIDTRANLLASLREVLIRHFPLVGNSCVKFGMAESCQRVFERLIDKDPNELISDSDLNLIVLVALGFDRVFRVCDEDLDGELVWTQGEGELDCGFEIIRQASLKMMDSEIIADDPEIRKMLQTLGGPGLAKDAGKAALIKGSMKGIGIELPIFWLGKKASPGSMLALLGELMTEGN